MRPLNSCTNFSNCHQKRSFFLPADRGYACCLFWMNISHTLSWCTSWVSHSTPISSLNSKQQCCDVNARAARSEIIKKRNENNHVATKNLNTVGGSRIIALLLVFCNSSPYLIIRPQVWMCYVINAPQGRRPIPHKDASSNCFSIDQPVNLFCECGYHYFVLKNIKLQESRWFCQAQSIINRPLVSHSIRMKDF